MPHLQALHWDYQDQLTEVELNGTGDRAYYNYDGGGQRVRKVVVKSGRRTERLYLGGVERYREYSANNTVKLERWTVQIDDIAQVDTLTVDSSGSVASPIPLIRYQYRDHLGSASLETNETGQVISYEEYHPFGTSAYRTAKSGTDLSLKRYRFTNKERDDETGLYYFGVRYYAAWLGRWTSSDPGGFVDGLNMYVYVRNNPVNGVDALGYETEPPPVEPSNALGAAADEVFVTASRMSDSEAAQRKMTRAGLTIPQQSTKLRSTGLMSALGDARAEGRGQDMDWAFSKPAYESSTYTSVLGRNAGRFLDGATDGAEESAEFAYNLLPGTERNSWWEMGEGVVALANLGLSINSTQIESLGIWKASDQSHQVVDQFEEQIRSIDFSDPYVWGKFAGSAVVEAVGGKFTGALAKSSKLSLATGGGNISFYSVQHVDDVARLKGGGTPWPTAPNRAHFGPGIYTWGEKAAASEYKKVLERFGAKDLEIVTLETTKSKVQSLKRFDLTALSDDAQNLWLNKHSSLFSDNANPVPHGFQSIIRGTGMGYNENYFSSQVWSIFKMK